MAVYKRLSRAPVWIVDPDVGRLADRRIAKDLGLNMVLVGLAVMALFGTVRRLPRTWHICGAGAAILFQTILIFPVFIAPMFNKYSPLTDARIRDPILRIARQNGIFATTVYQVDLSRQSKQSTPP